MFKQFVVAQFLISFIVFILAYMVASLSYDPFYDFLTAGMFLFAIWIMREARKNHQENLDRKEAECQERIREMQEQLDQKEMEYERLVRAITIHSTERDLE